LLAVAQQTNKKQEASFVIADCLYDIVSLSERVSSLPQRTKQTAVTTNRQQTNHNNKHPPSTTTQSKFCRKSVVGGWRLASSTRTFIVFFGRRMSHAFDD
jgi:hypothetical protein